MPRSQFIDFDPENVPLEIKTDSNLGSDKKLAIRFYNAQKIYAGGFKIKFSSTPQYDLLLCTQRSNSWINFATAVPSTIEKIWRITLDKSSGVRLIIHCNGVEVLDFLLSKDTCTSYSQWNMYWSRNLTMIRFTTQGKASDYYRPYTGN